MMRRIAFLWDMPDELSRGQAIIGGMALPILVLGAMTLGSLLVGWLS